MTEGRRYPSRRGLAAAIRQGFLSVEQAFGQSPRKPAEVRRPLATTAPNQVEPVFQVPQGCVRSAGPATAMPTGVAGRRPENVIYSYDPAYQPEYQFFSMPSACIGGASTLDEARNAYLSDVAALLMTPCSKLPRPVEHLEVATSGVWLRDTLDSTWPRSQTRRQVEAALLLDDRDGIVPFGLRTTHSAGGMPIIVITDPRDSVASILNQMTTFDALWIVYAADGQLHWVALCGPASEEIRLSSVTVSADTIADLAVGTFAAQYSTRGTTHIQLTEARLR